MPAGSPPGGDRRLWPWLLGIAAAGLVLRLAFAFGYWTGEVLTRDEREYLSLARSLAAGHGFVYDAEVKTGPIDPFGRAPGYPVFLALVGGGSSVTASVPGSVKTAQAVIGSLGVVLVGLLARQLAGDRAAIAAAAIAACYPPLVWISAYAFSEAIFWPLGLVIGRRVSFYENRKKTPDVFFTGVLTGAAILIRPAMLLFLPLAAAWLLWKRRPWAMLALVAGAMLVIAPWTIRNYQHHGRFVLVASEGGVTFWTGNHPLARGEGDLAANPALRREQQALAARYPSLSEEALEPIYYREALGWIAAHPIDWLALELRKVFYLIVPIGPSYKVHSTRYYVASVVSYGLLLLVALAGLVRLGSARRRTPGLWLLVASAILVCLVFFPQERFRIPVIDPALAVLAGTLWRPRSAVDGAA
jgi:4-amino-4-deoxy-L-arabinose transferase-like glycosyltransferase